MRSQVKSSGVDWVFYLGSLKAKIKVLGRLSSYLEALRKNALPLMKSVSRIQFLAVVELKSPFSCWLSVGDHTQHLETALKSLYVDPSIFKLSNSASNPSCASNHLTSPSANSWRKFCFQRTSQIWLTWIISLLIIPNQLSNNLN